MKTFNLLLVIFLGLALNATAQSTLPANVYPSNLEENAYFESYDPKTGVVSGLQFMVLADGNNSKDKTPAFEVSLYLIPVGKSSASDVIVIKTYKIDGLYHMGSMEYKSQTVNLNEVKNLSAGNYRLGLWVNSGKSFQEDSDDNAMLFQGELSFTPGGNSGATVNPAPDPFHSDDNQEEESEEPEFRYGR